VSLAPAGAGPSLVEATTTLLADLEISPPGSCLEDDLREAITSWACSAARWIEGREALDLALHISAHLSSMGWMLADWSSGEVRAFAFSDALDLAGFAVRSVFDFDGDAAI